MNAAPICAASSAKRRVPTMSEPAALDIKSFGANAPASQKGRGLKDAQLDALIFERTGGCSALAGAWPRSEWESARRVQQGLRPSVTVPGTFFAKHGVPLWLRTALRRAPLLEASHCAFPAWFAVASPEVDWFALAASQPDLRLTSDSCSGAPSIEALREAVRLAAGYTGHLTLHVVVAPISNGAEVEAMVVGIALSGVREDSSFLSLAIAQKLGFEPSRRLAFNLPRDTAPTLLSWEWSGPLLNMAVSAGDAGVPGRRSQ